MMDLKIEKRSIQHEGSIIVNSSESNIQLVFLGLLSVSFIGYFAFREQWIGFIFAHIAALSIMGFYGCSAGAIAKMKGYSYWRAFQIGFILPIILGVISAFLLPAGPRNLPLTCGGWTSLVVGIIIIVSYAFLKQRDNFKSGKKHVKSNKY
jgi:hypothetical protein